jgi:pimeloyl-ACP methyl ester carboxylesterase
VQKVFLVGASEGGEIAALMIEHFPDKYDGALALCGAIGGGPYQVQYLSDFRVVFDTFFPDVFSFGLADVPENAFLNWTNYTLTIANAIVTSPDATAQLYSVSGAALRKRLINERRIELAFEGDRFFDIRRWKIAASVENVPVRGMITTCPADAVASATCANLEWSKFSYNPNRVLLTKSAYPEKQNLLPVSTDELRRNPGLTQTPGW